MPVFAATDQLPPTFLPATVDDDRVALCRLGWKRPASPSSPPSATCSSKRWSTWDMSSVQGSFW